MNPEFIEITHRSGGISQATPLENFFSTIDYCLPTFGEGLWESCNNFLSFSGLMYILRYRSLPSSPEGNILIK